MFRSFDVKGKTFLVTGGAGFIGSHLVEALVARDAKVRVLDNFSTGRKENLAAVWKRIKVFEGDVTDQSACIEACAGVQRVFHLAGIGSVARCSEYPVKVMHVNCTGSVHVFAAAHQTGVERIVYASSCAVYGESAAVPCRETDEGVRRSVYGASKKTVELQADCFADLWKMDFVGLRYFNVYGPRQRADLPQSAVIPRFFAACRVDIAPVIFGDGLQTRDFIYVDDVVKANLLASDAPIHGAHVFNVGSGFETAIARLARQIQEIMCSDEPPEHVGEAHDSIRTSVADTSRASECLGFRSEVSLKDGLNRLRSQFLHE